MAALQPLTPGLTKAITVASSSAALALPSLQGNQIVITSLAANAVAFVAFGASTLTVVIPTGTAANGFPILPGTAQTFSLPANATHIATIGTAGNTLYMSVGDGE